MAQIRIDERRINDLFSRAWRDTAQGLDSALKQSITSPLYQWPRTTIRPSGEVAGSPRNIVARGDLLRSQQSRIDAFGGEWSWDVAHALIVHEGATLRSGTILPPRRWTREAYLKLYPLEPNYARNLKKLL